MAKKKLLKLLFSLFVGVAIAALWGRELPPWSWLTLVLTVIFMPGMIVGLMAGRGVHDPSETAIIVTTAIFWTGVVYFLLDWHARRKRR
jgi:hypothetical protein